MRWSGRTETAPCHSWPSHTHHFKTGHKMAALPDACCWRLKARTGRPSVSTLLLDETASLICFYLTVGVDTIVWANTPLRYTLHNISRVSNQNGVSLLSIMLEIHHSGQKPSISNNQETNCYTEMEVVSCVWRRWLAVCEGGGSLCVKEVVRCVWRRWFAVCEGGG